MDEEYNELLVKYNALLKAIERKDRTLYQALKFVQSSVYVLNRKDAEQDIQEAIDAGRRKSRYE